MKQIILTLCVALGATSIALAQQPTAPASRALTPAEQRQKEKIEREVQRERQIRAEWLQKQREYEARQAEKERQKQAKKAEKEQPPAPSVAKPQPAAEKPTAPAQATTPAPTTPTLAEPSRRERKEKRRKETVAEPVAKPADVPPAPVQVTTPDPQPTVTSEPVVKPARPKRERRKQTAKPTDSVAVSTTTETPALAEPRLSRPKHEFLPKGHLFDPILLDPLEAQTYGSVLPLYYTEGSKYKGSIVPFAFGFAKPFYRRTTAPGRSEEIVLDLASYTQFEVYWDADKGRQRRQIMNNDYKLSIIYNLRRGEHNWRFRVYHLSSHLGDDFIYRNRITAPSPNPVNYEQLDATYSRTVRDWRLYGGLGLVLRKAEERKPLSAQLGAFYKKSSERAARLVGGADIKFWQETQFRPGIHAGIGAEVGRTQNNLTFLLEGYSGFRPYSQYEDQQTSWLGVGIYLNPF